MQSKYFFIKQKLSDAHKRPRKNITNLKIFYGIIRPFDYLKIKITFKSL